MRANNTIELSKIFIHQGWTINLRINISRKAISYHRTNLLVKGSIATIQNKWLIPKLNWVVLSETWRISQSQKASLIWEEIGMKLHKLFQETTKQLNKLQNLSKICKTADQPLQVLVAAYLRDNFTCPKKSQCTKQVPKCSPVSLRAQWNRIRIGHLWTATKESTPCQITSLSKFPLTDKEIYRIYTNLQQRLMITAAEPPQISSSTYRPAHCSVNTMAGLRLTQIIL